MVTLQLHCSFFLFLFLFLCPIPSSFPSRLLRPHVLPYHSFNSAIYAGLSWSPYDPFHAPRSCSRTTSHRSWPPPQLSLIGLPAWGLGLSRFNRELHRQQQQQQRQYCVTTVSFATGVAVVFVACNIVASQRTTARNRGKKRQEINTLVGTS